jgi:hypothetical protein
MRVPRLLALPLVALPLVSFQAGCSESGPMPSAEVQQQNFDDEQKAMENAKQPQGKGRPSGI